ncbi:hypothetical protein [Chromobacterium subtsugae]|uniref:hypothetical protein n=1 Tax=Chromobacterium subtsugae TaxID=251747 RepID=UPI0012D405BE|nr:hypothetical protein [Chromobacterium subtsugae]
MRLVRVIMVCTVLAVLLAWVSSSPPIVKYDHLALGEGGLVEIYFSSDKNDFGGAYNIACALSEKTKYPNVFPDDGIAIYGKVINKIGGGKFKAMVFMDGFSRSGQYAVGKFDIDRELNGEKYIPCVIYRKGFFSFGETTKPIEVPVKDLYSVLSW